MQELFFPLRLFCFPILFLPLNLLVNIIPYVYFLVFLQPKCHFMISCSYFLLLCKSLCIISPSPVGFATLPCTGSLPNGLNKSPKPVPSCLRFPICGECSHFNGTLLSPGAHAVPCRAAELSPCQHFCATSMAKIHRLLMLQEPPCASAVGRCPPHSPTWHEIPVWASPMGSPHGSQHRGTAALHQLKAGSVGLSVARPGGEVGLGNASPRGPGTHRWDLGWTWPTELS